jgi:dTDP-4-amino-4,6-dideoxygalactose transaminase
MEAGKNGAAPLTRKKVNGVNLTKMAESKPHDTVTAEKMVNSKRRLSIWPTLPLDVYFRTASPWQPFPLNQESCRIYSRARHAIWNVCQSLGLSANDVVLMPAYHHGSEVEAMLQAGVKIRYYEVSESLEPDPHELEALLGPEVRALYIIHYMGFPQAAGYWREWCDERSLLLIEDAAQAFLSERDGRPVGSFGQAGIFCLYKTYGIPDGGAVVSSSPSVYPSSEVQSGWWRAFKRHFNWVAQHRTEVGAMHLMLKPVIAWAKRKIDRPHQEFDLGDPLAPPCAVTMSLLPKIVDPGTAERRRENYRFLLSHFKDLVPLPFAILPDGACPFGFPVMVNEPRAFLKRLHAYGVVGLLFWINPHPSLPVADFPRSRVLREGVIALPVHQELTRSELQQIVDAVRRSYAFNHNAAPLAAIN